MCLCLFDNSEQTILEQPLSVFKVAKLLNDTKVSPFFHKELVGEVTSEIVVRYDSILKRDVINKGLHSFLYLSDAEAYMKALRDDRLFIIPCVIPAGAKSYIGSTSFRGKSYTAVASDKLLF